MTIQYEDLKKFAESILEKKTVEEVMEALAPKVGKNVKRFKSGGDFSKENIEKRWEGIEGVDEPASLFNGEGGEVYAKNIENFVGTVNVPLGVAGPIRINGIHAQGDYLLPFATTEAALVASTHRGAALVSNAGGCSVLLMAEGVTRSPAFAFPTIREMTLFTNWVLSQKEKLEEVANATTNHGKLQNIRIAAEGNHVYLLCDYTTGDASGQNMVTIATQAICDYIIKSTPIKPSYWFVEANASGDKKASGQSFTSVRGKKVCAEVIIPGKLIERFLHTSSKAMVDYWRMSALGGIMTGTIGVQGHYANGLAALFIACGQDAACVAEAAVGITRMEETEDGSLYASVTLPNLIVGTVGGGTSLPSQKACLQMMNLYGAGNSRAFAEVCAGAALAGELSIIGALSAGDFTSAHQNLARER